MKIKVPKKATITSVTSIRLTLALPTENLKAHMTTEKIAEELRDLVINNLSVFQDGDKFVINYPPVLQALNPFVQKLILQARIEERRKSEDDWSMSYNEYDGYARRRIKDLQSQLNALEEKEK